MITVLIAAKNAAPFIKECLHSVYAQTYFAKHPYEVLIGVDDCPETLNKVLTHKNEHTRVFKFGVNVGPYIIFNTLLQHAKEEVVTIFGADDIMKLTHIEKGTATLKKNHVVVAKGINFRTLNKRGRVIEGDGIIFAKKSDLLGVNGFAPWFCAADTDMIKRLSFFGVDRITMPEPTFMRRIHEKNLTVVDGFKMNSEYRNNLKKVIKNRSAARLEQFSVSDKYQEVIEL